MEALEISLLFSIIQILGYMQYTNYVKTCQSDQYYFCR